MKLATVTEVTERMNVGSINQLNTAATSVLEAVTPIVESLLQTGLEASTRIDWFDYRPSKFSRTFTEYKIMLDQAYVEGKPKLYLSTDGVRVPKSFTDLTVTDVLDYEVDTRRGLIRLFLEPYTGSSTIAVKYSSGFQEGSSEIPAWMKEAAISAAIRVLHTHSITHNKKDFVDTSAELRRLLYAQCSMHVRSLMSGMSPSVSMVL